MSGIRERGLRADLARRLELCPHGDLRLVDELLLGIEQRREEMVPVPEIVAALCLVQGVVADRDRRALADRFDLGGES